MRFLSSLALVIGCAVISAAQTPVAPVWHTLTSSNAEFSVTVPSDYIVQDERLFRQVRVAGGNGGAYFDASFSKTGGGKSFIEGMRRMQATKGFQATFDIGDAEVYTYTSKAEQRFRFSIYVATRKGYYAVSMTSLSPDNTILQRMLVSLQYDGKPLLKSASAQAPIAASVINVSSLETSELVRAALRRKQTEPITIESAVVSAAGSEDEPEKFYSRSVMILSKAHAKYSEEARSNNVAGTIRLRVLLKANGNIGKITVLSGLPHGLTEQAIRAAKEIKFLPAEINGVPADAETTIEYTFSIY